MSPAVSMSYWSIFERNNLVGLADFARSKFRRMANWLTQFQVFDRNWMNGTKPASDSFRKLTNVSLRQRLTFFNVPGRKNLRMC